MPTNIESAPAGPEAPARESTFQSSSFAGVPRAVLVILMGTAASFGLPEWPILAILGIDELMDMARTSVNVIGNCLATVVIARWEGQFKDKPEQTAAA